MGGMVGRNPELDAARERLRAAEKRATRKLNRTAKENRVMLHGTRLDPRRGASIDRLTMKQVQARLERVEKFNKPSTQFYGDNWGRVLPPKLVAEWKRTARRANREILADYEKFKRKRLPSGETIDTRMKKERQRQSGYKRNVSNVQRVADPLPVKPVGFSSAQALRRALEYHKAVQGERMARATSQGRKQIREMVDEIGDPALRRELDSLDDEQFAKLIFFTNFVDTLKMRYVDKKEQEIDPNFEPTKLNESESRQLLDWAAKKRR